VKARAGGRGDLIAAALCILVGIALSILPHLLWWPRLGAPIWIADLDDLMYLTFASQAYENHPAYLGNPNHVSGVPSMYPWLQFVPGILVAKALGLGPLGINFVWRVWAGFSIALGWFLLLRHYVGRPWVAAGLTIFLLADIGLLAGRPLVNQATYLVRLVTGDGERHFVTTPVLGNVPVLAGIPGVCPQWRIITPGLNLVFLLMYLWLLARARTKPTWPRIVGAGVGFGLLFYAYFYYWTAAGLALVFALVLDASHRRVYFNTGWIGGLVGLPPVISSALLKRATSPDWLHRSDLFLPISRFSQLLIPKAALILLVVLGLFLLWMRRKELSYLWALAASGLILANNQVLTGLEIQNMHWQWYTSGPSLSLLSVLVVVGLARGRGAWPRPVVAGLWILCALYLGLGFYLRTIEATQNRLSISILNDYQRYRTQRFGPSAVKLAPNAVMAGDLRFVDLAAVLENQRPLFDYSATFNPEIDNVDWHTRFVLNDYLRGLDRPTFEAHQRKSLSAEVWGPWAHDSVKRAENLAARLAVYDRITADPGRVISQFGVRYVALLAGSSSSPGPEESWARIESGPSCDIWEYRAHPRP
jgi:hypothetical protein